ncbi:unnamed protein product [Didymodactylos carnosus]|nr:unnamed protein product [Didymodactylos carnosus]CAF3789696.1 unnamed protein product [Didymodactylos carnosus]
MATYYVQELGKNKILKIGKPTVQWYYSFMIMHPEIKTVTPIPLELPRAKIAQAIVDKWFSLLEQVINENNLLNKPSQIYNCDESGFADNTDTTKYIVSNPTKFPYKKQGGTGKSYYSDQQVPHIIHRKTAG